MTQRPPSRLDGARQRAAAAKRGLAIGSAAAFGLVALWAHGSHPGVAAVQNGGDGSAVLTDDDDDDVEDFGFGSGSISPSIGGTPDTGTHVS